MADWASESGHWYDSVTGEPRYTIISKNGVERATTLRDARPNGWVPSVTTITACAARYALEAWKQQQVLMAALTMPRVEGETEDAWLKRIILDSQEQAKKAAARGTEIHAAIESFWRTGMFIEGTGEWVRSVNNLLIQNFGAQEWLPEKSFASPLGYGGKVDLHSDSVLLDFKGKEGLRAKGAKTYDEHHMQLAAYAAGLKWIPDGEFAFTCGIVFFDRDEPYSELHIVKPADLERGWEMFKALLAYWKAANRYEA